MKNIDSFELDKVQFVDCHNKRFLNKVEKHLYFMDCFKYKHNSMPLHQMAKHLTSFKSGVNVLLPN